MPVCVSYNDTASKGSSPSILPVRLPGKHSQQMLLEWQKMLLLSPQGRRDTGNEPHFEGSISTVNLLLVPNLEE